MQDITSMVLGRKPNMTRTEIYLEASRQLAEGEQDYSCIAINRVNHDWYMIFTRLDPVVKAYCGVFNPDHEYDEFPRIVGSDEDPRNLRVMMTSLMAVCWEDFQ